MAADCIDSQTASISDGEDMLARGVISYFNILTEELGVEAGQPCQEAATLLCKANQFTGEPNTSDEPLCHKLSKINGISVIGLDIMLLIQENDAGKIMLTGFHGGLVGGVFLAGPPVALPSKPLFSTTPACVPISRAPTASLPLACKNSSLHRQCHVSPHIRCDFDV